jgi:bifunctional non-homologous end joining protein LigD
VKSFTQQVAQAFTEHYPDRNLSKVLKPARRGRTFIDYLRNGRGTTAIAPYSTRAKPEATISVPLTWKELSTDVRSDG